MASFTIPGCLAEAEQLKKEHEQFQVAIEVSHESESEVRKGKVKEELVSKNKIYSTTQMTTPSVMWQNVQIIQN